MTYDMKWDMRFLAMAQLVSTWSKDPSTQVGAVIVRPDRTIVSTGFNGFPRGFSDDEARYLDRTVKYKVVKHAEENAILFAKEPLNGCTLYVYPLPPCSLCAGDIAQSGIARVVSLMNAKSAARWENPDDRVNFGFDLSLEIFTGAQIEFNLYRSGTQDES